jgi:histidine ammonia-lyase
MGTIAARKARDIIFNVENVIAIELLAACQALEFGDTTKMAPATKIAYDLVRAVVPKLEEDRVMYHDINKVFALVKSHVLVDKVESTIGQLK